MMKHIGIFLESIRRKIDAHRRGLFFVICPQCKRKMRVDELLIGKSIDGEVCPHCYTLIISHPRRAF